MRGVDIPMHFHVRLRSPLSHYISYFLWTVVERQARNARRFGSSFAEWARTVPNLQSELLLSSKAATPGIRFYDCYRGLELTPDTRTQTLSFEVEGGNPHVFPTEPRAALLR